MPLKRSYKMEMIGRCYFHNDRPPDLRPSDYANFSAGWPTFIRMSDIADRNMAPTHSLLPGMMDIITGLEDQAVLLMRDVPNVVFNTFGVMYQYDKHPSDMLLSFHSGGGILKCHRWGSSKVILKEIRVSAGDVILIDGSRLVSFEHTSGPCTIAVATRLT